MDSQTFVESNQEETYTSFMNLDLYYMAEVWTYIFLTKFSPFFGVLEGRYCLYEISCK